jgi:hypothetical protein
MSLQHNTVNTRWQHLRPCRGLCSLSENESQENELLCASSLSLRVTTLRWSRGKSGCWAKGNPSCGFVDPWWAIVRTAESSTARESRLLVHSQRHQSICWTALLPATTCLRKMAWGFEQIYSRVSRICEVYIRPSPLHSQGFAHELLYQANNRAAEVTMYGEMEVYTKTTTE